MRNKEFKKEKKVLDFLILNLEGEASVLDKMDLAVIKSMENRNYLEINGEAYKITEKGIADYLKFYNKKNFMDGMRAS